MKLWKLHLPPKVKSFLWRMCDGCLSTLSQLVIKGVITSLSCLLYGSDVEHVWYIFINCPYAKGCWSYADVIFHSLEFDDIRSWFGQCLESGSNDLINRISITLWSIWNQRNKKL